MNDLIVTKTRTRLTWGVTGALMMAGCLLALSALVVQSQDKQPKAVTATWPETAPYTTAIHAFDAALTRSGWDMSFRQRLTASPDSAKAAVAEEGNINIPANKVIVFYEPQPPRPNGPRNASAAQDADAYLPVALGSTSKSNENIHVFYLPPFKENDKARQYRYEVYFMCCYDQWTRQ